MIKYKKPILIAEILCNHMGNIKNKKMIETAALSGADYVKFQKETINMLGNDYNKPHPVPENSFGNTYGKYREYLEFSINQQKQLAKYCQKIILSIQPLYGK